MKVLVTGSNGFIGKNLIERLNHSEELEVITFSRDDTLDSLERDIKDIDFIFHLAGVNRPEVTEAFYQDNAGLTQEIIALIEKNTCNIPMLMTSSSQADLDNDYSKSKRQGEELIKAYADKNHVSVYIYRLTNVFGKWCRPNYNSVVATWCYNITHDLPILVNDETTELDLIYIDDVVETFVSHLHDNASTTDTSYEVSTVYKKSLKEIRDLLLKFKQSRENLIIPEVGSGFERALYATYLTYLPVDNFSYPLNGHHDDRGTFYEILKTFGSGQFSISTTRPGVTRGNHYHNSKNEKFLVIKGEAVIKLRQIHSDEVISYRVSDKKMEVVEMIPGYTHNITNVGNDEMIFFIWANEVFDRDNPDTFYLEV